MEKVGRVYGFQSDEEATASKWSELTQEEKNKWIQEGRGAPMLAFELAGLFDYVINDDWEDEDWRSEKESEK